MIYVDTSYIAKCYVNESGSDQVVAWLEGKHRVSCSIHGRMEFYSSIKRNIRERKISPSGGEDVFRRFLAHEKHGAWNWLSVDETTVHYTCQRIAALPDEVPIRAADALHLGCAAKNGFIEVYSHDRHFLAAAPFFGLVGKDVIGGP